MLTHYGLPCRGRLELISQIPEGKGLASSSADLVATARAVASGFGLPLTYRELESFLRAIEPTDGVMYPGVVAFFHRRVELVERLGFLPPLIVLSVDEGGIIDTVEFNRRRRDYTAQERAEYQALLERVKACLGRGDLQGLGEVTTRSAELNQRINPKRHLERMLDICRATEALGVVTAHSGTCLGLLLSADDPAHRAKLEEATRRLDGLSCPIEVYQSWQWRSEQGAPDASVDNPLWLRPT
jgi:L-threonine kinase